MSQYANILQQQAAKAVKIQPEKPKASLGIGSSETLAPVRLITEQKPAPAQSRPKVQPNQNRDQLENIKALPPLEL